jgi:hypothetical protein
MNSAMMPNEGNYFCKRIDEAQFALILWKNKDNFKSYLGYPENCEFVINLIRYCHGSTLTIPISRDQTHLKSGDKMLVIKLKYRLPDPSAKGKFVPKAEDYEFFLVEYRI